MFVDVTHVWISFLPKADLRPGKMVVCKACGCIGPDFNACIRCKRKIPEDAKVIDDPDKPKPRIIAKVQVERPLVA